MNLSWLTKNDVLILVVFLVREMLGYPLTRNSLNTGYNFLRLNGDHNALGMRFLFLVLRYSYWHTFYLHRISGVLMVSNFLFRLISLMYFYFTKSIIFNKCVLKLSLTRTSYFRLYDFGSSIVFCATIKYKLLCFFF